MFAMLPPLAAFIVAEVAAVAAQAGAVKYFQLLVSVTTPYPWMTETPCAPTPVTQLERVPALNFFTAEFPAKQREVTEADDAKRGRVRNQATHRCLLCTVVSP